MMLAAGVRPSAQRLCGNKSICIAPKAAMKPTLCNGDFSLAVAGRIETGVGAMRF